MKSLVSSLMVVLFVAGMALAASDSSRPPMPREELLEKLTDALRALDSWNIAGAKRRLEKLLEELINDPSAYNQAAKNKVVEIVNHLSQSQVSDADQKLHKLVKQVQNGVVPSRKR